MEAMLAIKNVRQPGMNEIRPSYPKTNYLNVSAATHLPERNRFQPERRHWCGSIQRAFLGCLQREGQ